MTAQLAEIKAVQTGLVIGDEAYYVVETPTGLVFRDDTPLEIAGPLLARLIRQHKKIEWAIGDAINFLGRKYGGMYEQWAHETGLSESTLSTIAWVARTIESSRRREDVGWSHHREIASIADPAEQDQLLEEVAVRGMTRFEVRQEVKQRRDAITVGAGGAVEPATCAADQPWTPTADDLLPEHRRAVATAAVEHDHVDAFVAGALWMARYTASEALFRAGVFRD